MVKRKKVKGSKEKMMKPRKVEMKKTEDKPERKMKESDVDYFSDIETLEGTILTINTSEKSINMTIQQE